MPQSSGFLANVPQDKRNKLIEAVVNSTKTHAESREFKAKNPKSKALEFELELVFEDEQNQQSLNFFQILWNVRHGNREKVASLSARLRLDKERIRGIDWNAAPISYKFQENTASNAYWHENVIYFDRKGIMQNKHEPLKDWHGNYSRDEFARKTADHWNINTWREQEELLSWQQ